MAFFTATETAQQLKRSAGVPFHAKGRGLLRKMDTTSKACVLSGRCCLLFARQDGLTFPHQKNHAAVES